MIKNKGVSPMATTATNKVRDALAREVLGDLLTTATKLPVEHPGGVRPIVVALADELLVDVWPRVDDAGRSANLFVRMNDGSLALLEARYSIAKPFAIDLGTMPVEQGHTIGKMVELATASKHGLTFRMNPAARLLDFPGKKSRRFAFVEVETFAA